ncbi:MAG: AAA domain-containing protein [Tannerellaceae bacterium]|nr:AAA domain-containing protein [Tannerellaceae bacterium]
MASKDIITPFKQLQLQYDLLQKEYEYEKEMFRSQTERQGIWKKQQQGICWYPVAAGRTYYNSLDQLVIELERTDERDTEHGFEHGRPVCFFEMGEGERIRYLNFSGTISYMEENRMVVVMPGSEPLTEFLQLKRPGVQLFFDETSYKTMFATLQTVMRAKGNRLAYLRDTLLGKDQPEERQLFPVRFPWLNPSQEAAVNKVLAAKDVSVVHGPPGTGKTTTLVEAIYETLHRENQLLVCAQSNMAVDWISEKLADRGINVLRIGNPTRVNDKMLSFTYERRFEAHPDYPELWNIRKTIRSVQGSLRKKSYDERETVRNRLSRLRFRATELEVKIDADLFSEARVVACTLVGAAGKILNGHHFTSLFIDEAAQALEAACWIAIERADRVILAGDHCQLPPTIKCPEAARSGLGQTLLQKLADTHPAVVSLLRTQYRMHQDIMNFPSVWFYQGRLEAAPEVQHRGILQWDRAIEWIDTSGEIFTEHTNPDTLSRINKEEAALLVAKLQAYIEKIGRERVLEEQIDFGLISPYKAQIQYIRRLIKRNTFFKPYRKLVTVHTVDGFQGQERDVVMISLVRSNDTGKIGFLSDLRRMNVAITRARMKLIILGDATTLSHHPFYRKLYQYVQHLQEE